MLEKNKKSAVILSSIVVLSFTLVLALEIMLVPYLASGGIHAIVAYPERLTNSWEIISLVGLIIILLLVLIGVGALWLYRFFGERYFGKRSAIRWALFGAAFALLLKVPDLFTPASIGFLTCGWGVASLFLAFFLTRWIMPLNGS